MKFFIPNYTTGFWEEKPSLEDCLDRPDLDLEAWTALMTTELNRFAQPTERSMYFAVKPMAEHAVIKSTEFKEFLFYQDVLELTE